MLCVAPRRGRMSLCSADVDRVADNGAAADDVLLVVVGRRRLFTDAQCTDADRCHCRWSLVSMQLRRPSVCECPDPELAAADPPTAGGVTADDQPR